MRTFILLFCIFQFSIKVFCQSPVQSKAFVLGQIIEINSAELAEKRTLNIYLPDEDHATITHQSIFNAFRLLYPLKGLSR